MTNNNPDPDPSKILIESMIEAKERELLIVRKRQQEWRKQEKLIKDAIKGLTALLNQLDPLPNLEEDDNQP